jgi:hypothetical protein
VNLDNFVNAKKGNKNYIVVILTTSRGQESVGLLDKVTDVYIVLQSGFIDLSIMNTL